MPDVETTQELQSQETQVAPEQRIAELEKKIQDLNAGLHDRTVRIDQYRTQAQQAEDRLRQAQNLYKQLEDNPSLETVSELTGIPVEKFTKKQKQVFEHIEEGGELSDLPDELKPALRKIESQIQTSVSALEKKLQAAEEKNRQYQESQMKQQFEKQVSEIIKAEFDDLPLKSKQNAAIQLISLAHMGVPFDKAVKQIKEGNEELSKTAKKTQVKTAEEIKKSNKLVPPDGENSGKVNPDNGKKQYKKVSDIWGEARDSFKKSQQDK